MALLMHSLSLSAAAVVVGVASVAAAVVARPAFAAACNNDDGTGEENNTFLGSSLYFSHFYNLSYSSYIMYDIQNNINL